MKIPMKNSYLMSHAPGRRRQPHPRDGRGHRRDPRRGEPRRERRRGAAGHVGRRQGPADAPGAPSHAPWWLVKRHVSPTFLGGKSWDDPERVFMGIH